MDKTTKAKQQVSASGKARQIWTDKEVAFVLNFVDYCLRDERDYKAVVVTEFANFTKRQVNLKAINNKLRGWLSTHSRRGATASLANFIENGTQLLSIRSLSSTLFAEMQAQRKSWGLDGLDEGQEAESSAEHDDTKAAALTTASVSG
jgi:hypothetical protein